MVIKRADCSYTDVIGNLNRFLPSLRIHFAIETPGLVLAKSGTITAVHGFMFESLVYLVLSQAPALSFKDGVFELKRGATLIQERWEHPARGVVDKVSYRKDDVFVVWDSRGLNIRKGKKLLTTQLPEIALTPKLFERSEILDTKRLVAQKQRTLTFTNLAGSRRVGTIVYLLPQWVGADGKPWLEALVKVDLLSANPKPQLLGRFDGLSAGPLRVEGSKLTVVVKQLDGTWGLAAFEPTSSVFEFKPLGKNLVDFTLSGTAMIVVETKEYGTTMVSQIEPKSNGRKALAENRGIARWIDPSEPMFMRFDTKGLSRIQNLRTGAVLEFDKKLEARLAFGGLLLVAGNPKPTGATLFDLERLEALASWQAPPSKKSLSPT